VTTVLSNLRTVEPTSSSITYWIVGISTFSLITILFCCYSQQNLKVRNWGCCCMRVTKGLHSLPYPRRRTGQGVRLSSERNSSIATEIPLHVVVPGESGETTGQGGISLELESRAPTPFVSRGRVPASADQQ
jgi:hypothetical protein